jgi:vacuolar-type H+-ATPase subunit F/Vma7
MSMIRGATYEIEVVITNSDTNAPLDLTGVEGILVGLYGDGRRLFGKWSYVDKTAEGYGLVTVVDAAAGKISVALERADTQQALEKVAKLEVVVALPNPMFDGGTQYSIDTEISLEQVRRSVFEGISAT